MHGVQCCTAFWSFSLGLILIRMPWTTFNLHKGCNGYVEFTICRGICNNLVGQFGRYHIYHPYLSGCQFCYCSLTNIIQLNIYTLSVFKILEFLVSLCIIHTPIQMKYGKNHLCLPVLLADTFSPRACVKHVL